VRDLVFRFKNKTGSKVRRAYADEHLTGCTIRAIRRRMDFISAVSCLAFSRLACLFLAVTAPYMTWYVIDW
jgi:hypothetical protein